MDSDMIWFVHQVVNQPFIRSDLDGNLKHPKMNYWRIPIVPYQVGAPAGSIMLLRSDYREQDGGKSLFTLEEAININDRLIDRFGLGLITVKQWINVYNYVATFFDYDSQMIANNLHMRFLSKEDAYWTASYSIKCNSGRLEGGSTFVLNKNIQGLKIVERHPSSKLPIRLCVADELRFNEVLSQEGLPYSRDSDDARIVLPF